MFMCMYVYIVYIYLYEYLYVSVFGALHHRVIVLVQLKYHWRLQYDSELLTRETLGSNYRERLHAWTTMSISISIATSIFISLLVYRQLYLHQYPRKA